jgi:tRNA dimethylallyltransferase
MTAEISGRPSPPVLVICGPTASGKTALALDLAEQFGGEIISADSRQAYRHMNIGTAKATLEERRRVPHHLIDIVDPDQEYTAADFARQGRPLIEEILGRRRFPFVVGGTGLYIRTLTEGLLPAPGADHALRRQLLELECRDDPAILLRRLQEVDPFLAERLHPADRVRIIRGLEVYTLTGRPLSALQAEHAFQDRPFRLLKIGLSLVREDLYQRIDRRVDAMMEAGLLEEVRKLLEQGYHPHLKALQTIGYREGVLHLQGALTLDQAVDYIQQSTRRYAKRQLTWFRKDPEIIWVDSFRESDRIQQLIENFYAE